MKKIGSIFLILFVLLSAVASAAGMPMLQRYVKYVDPWEYSKTCEHFIGYIPALGYKVSDNKWKLYQWQGVFTFADGQKQIIDNYDVFAVK